MKSVAMAFAAAVVVAACTQHQQPYPQQAYARPSAPQGYPPPPYPQHPYPPQAYPPQPYPPRGYPAQPYPGQPPPQPRPVPPPPYLGTMSTDPDVVAACRRAEDDWARACGCPMHVVVDMSSTQGLTTELYSVHDFELQGKHFCETISSGNDIHGHSIAIGAFCKGREREMCSISGFRFTRVASSGDYDCAVSNGLATPHSTGQMYSIVDNCYKRVTKW